MDHARLRLSIGMCLGRHTFLGEGFRAEIPRRNMLDGLNEPVPEDTDSRSALCLVDPERYTLAGTGTAVGLDHCSL